MKVEDGFHAYVTLNPESKIFQDIVEKFHIKDLDCLIMMVDKKQVTKLKNSDMKEL